jgi:hypothetical protein
MEDASSSDGSSELEVPYAMDFSSDSKACNNDDSDGSSSDSGIFFESPGRQKAREPLRTGDVIAYTSPIFTTGVAHGERQASVVGCDPTHAEYPLVLDNCEHLPWDTFIQRIGEWYKGKVRPHPGRRKPISSFLLKASKKSRKELLASVIQSRAAKVKGALRGLERDAMKAYTTGQLPPSSSKKRPRTLESTVTESAGTTSNKPSSLGLFPSVARSKRPRKSSTEESSFTVTSRATLDCDRGRASKPTRDGLPASNKTERKTKASASNKTAPRGSTNHSKKPSLSESSSSSSSSEDCVVNDHHHDSDDSSISVPTFRTQSLSTTLTASKPKAVNSHAVSVKRRDVKDQPIHANGSATKAQQSLSDTDEEEEDDDDDGILCTQNIPFYSEYKPPFERQPQKKKPASTTSATKSSSAGSGGFLSFSKQNNYSSSTPVSNERSIERLLPPSSTDDMGTGTFFSRTTKLSSSAQNPASKSLSEQPAMTTMPRKRTSTANSLPSTSDEDSSSDDEPTHPTFLKLARPSAASKPPRATKESAKTLLGDTARPNGSTAPSSSHKYHDVRIDDSRSSNKAAVGAEKLWSSSRTAAAANDTNSKAKSKPKDKNKGGNLLSLVDSDSDSNNEFVNPGGAREKTTTPRLYTTDPPSSSLVDRTATKALPSRKSKMTLDETLGLDEDDDESTSSLKNKTKTTNSRRAPRRQQDHKNHIDLGLYSDDDDDDDGEESSLSPVGTSKSVSGKATARTTTRSLEIVSGGNYNKVPLTKPARRSMISSHKDHSGIPCRPLQGEHDTLSVDRTRRPVSATTIHSGKQKSQDRATPSRYEKLYESDTSDDEDLDLVGGRDGIIDSSRNRSRPIQEGKKNSEDHKTPSRSSNRERQSGAPSRRGNGYHFSVAPSVLERVTTLPKSQGKNMALKKKDHPLLSPSDSSDSDSPVQRGPLLVGPHINQKRKRVDLSLSSSSDESSVQIVSRRRSGLGKNNRKSVTSKVPSSWSSDCEIDSPPASTPRRTKNVTPGVFRRQDPSQGKRRDVSKAATSPVFDFVDEPTSSSKKRRVALQDNTKRKRSRIG